MSKITKKPIFDNIHGFIHLTTTEDQVVSSPYFQRLRWIKQLGWSHYIFPGATHTRFSHALGAMFVMDKILKAIGRGVDDNQLFDPTVNDAKTKFHRTMRLAALLHDIGTFPFSHSTEQGYIDHYKKLKGKKSVNANHEELGSHIIKNTDFEGGLTHILKHGKIDSDELSLIIRGRSSHALANQLIHSDVDADRIDYLIRDSLHSGAKYGTFDVDYLISNMRVVKHNGVEVLAINESAMNVVEYFLICRYSWYAQIIYEGSGYKFDLIASQLTEYFLESGLSYTFDELKQLVTKNPKKFFGFNDSYFTNLLQQTLDQSHDQKISLSPVVQDQLEMLLFRIPLQHLKLAPFESSLIKSEEERSRMVSDVQKAVDWLREQTKNIPQAWIIAGIPHKDILFTKSKQALIEAGTDSHAWQESVKIVDRDNNVRLLVDTPNSLMGILAQYRSFVPRIYVSRNTYRVLESKGLLTALEAKFGFNDHPTTPLKKAG